MYGNEITDETAAHFVEVRVRYLAIDRIVNELFNDFNHQVSFQTYFVLYSTQEIGHRLVSNRTLRVLQNLVEEDEQLSR